VAGGTFGSEAAFSTCPVVTGSAGFCSGVIAFGSSAAAFCCGVTWGVFCRSHPPAAKTRTARAASHIAHLIIVLLQGIGGPQPDPEILTSPLHLSQKKCQFVSEFLPTLE
jgi:hypothetical protein